MTKVLKSGGLRTAEYFLQVNVLAESEIGRRQFDRTAYSIAWQIQDDLQVKKVGDGWELVRFTNYGDVVNNVQQCAVCRHSPVLKNLVIGHSNTDLQYHHS